MAKDHVSKNLRILIDDESPAAKDLSNDLVPGSLGAVGLDFERIDMTGSSDGVKKAMGNRASADIEARFYANTAADRATDVLNAIDDGETAGTLTVQYGQGGAPENGDLEWEGEYILLRNTLVNDGGRIVHDCLFAPNPDSADPAWGVVAL